MLEITEQNYEEVIGKTNLPVVLDFGATWCGPCQVIKPYIEKMGNCEMVLLGGDHFIFAQRPNDCADVIEQLLEKIDKK